MNDEWREEQPLQEGTRVSPDILQQWRADLARTVIFSILLITALTMGVIGWRWYRQAITRRSAIILLVSLALSIPVYLLMLGRLRHGASRRTMVVMLAAIFIGLGLFIFFWGGRYSPAWLFYIWAVMLAGMLLGPKWTFRAALIVLGYYALLRLLEMRWPSISTLPQDARNFFPIFVPLLFLLVAVTTYIDVSTKEGVIEELTRLKASLEESRMMLEERVQERTAMLTERARQLEIIADLNRFMMSTTSLDQLLTTIVDLLSSRLDFYHVGIFLLDDTGSWLRLYAASSLGGKRMMARSHKLRVGEEGIVGHVGATLRPRIAADVGEDAVWFDNPDLPETRSEMALPLVAADQLIGVLDIQSRRPNAFTSEDVETLSILANALSVAISNVRLLSRYRSTLDRLERYRTEDVISGWRKALRRRNQVLALDYDHVDVRTLSPEEVAIEFADSPVETVEEIVVAEEDGAATLTVPLRARDLDLGYLRFEASRQWTEDELELVRAIVEQISLALENARLLEDSRFRAEQEAARSQIVASIRSSVQIDAILRSAAQELGRALDVERVRVQLLPPDLRNEGEPDDA